MTDTAGTADPGLDHAGLGDTFAARRYFRKFERITGHLPRVAAVMAKESAIRHADLDVVGDYVAALARSFRALSLKYLMTGRDTGRFFGSLAIDRVESGFPVFRELLTMANDAQQAGRHLDSLPTVETLKEQMVRAIVADLEIPTRLQFATSQRLYYEALAAGGLFWTQNDPVAVWLSGLPDADRRRYLIHWAVYDSQTNLPVIYLMEVEDTGRVALGLDHRRWPEAQAALIAQSLAGLKLVTIAQGFDEDFDDLHPKTLRRIHLGPMYSHAYTLQTGPIREVLENAAAPEGEDWALAWTLEELESDRVRSERTGWFTTAEREVFALDPFAGRGAETGATRTERAIILPQRPFQVLAEWSPPGFREVRKFVVSKSGQVIHAR
ncbi:hypothetical protein [Anianabacter salinae]|uniref:hypothetical protein n=1 Tax=Anianabacter salinae TaxID=2851023 RepID=UPI00225DF700|nr:hypothetical protein [Anianabacter salinae]MBV0913055.1 hypothetical protein [Anianabacter salinae]